MLEMYMYSDKMHYLQKMTEIIIKKEKNKHIYVYMNKYNIQKYLCIQFDKIRLKEFIILHYDIINIKCFDKLKYLV